MHWEKQAFRLFLVLAFMAITIGTGVLLAHIFPSLRAAVYGSLALLVPAVVALMAWRWYMGKRKVI